MPLMTVFIRDEQNRRTKYLCPKSSLPDHAVSVIKTASDNNNATNEKNNKNNNDLLSNCTS